MEKIQLVAIDADGTCFKNHGDIIAVNIEPIIKVYKKGVQVVFITGRPFYKIFDDLKNSGLEPFVNFIISDNGTHMYDVQQKITINQSLIKKEAVAKIYEECKKWNVWLWIYSEDIKKSYTNFNYHGFLECDFLLPDSKVENREITIDNSIKAYQIIIYKNPKVETSNIHAIAHLCRTMNIQTYYVPHYAYIASIMNKGTALEMLAKKLKIKPENIMAIGDSENDIPMFKYARWAVAMKNAKLNVQTYANAITDTDINGGVAKALEKYILLKK